MKCPRCKKQLRKGAKFCPACGTRIEKKRGIRFTSILLVIALLLGIVAVGWGSGILIAKYFGGSFKNLFSGKENVEIHNVEEAIAHAKNLGKEYGYENALSELTEKITTTIDGDSYYRLQQNYQGIPVYGRNIVYVTDSNGVTTSISGNAFDVDSIEQIVPSVLEHQILEAVAAYHKDVLGIDTGNLDLNIQNDAELYIYNLDEKESHLAYCIYVDGYEYLVDAHSAEILLVNCLIRFADIIGDLEGQIKTHENISYTQENNVYSLVDSSRNISAYTADNEYKWLQAKWVQKSENLVVWNSGETVDSSAVDAFVNVQTAYDYFDKVLQNKSIDGSGKKQIKVITGVLDLQDNACFSLAQEVINFGNANRYNYDKSAYIDWVAHEYMHGVEHNHSGMIYQGESGAVMEALSDIFGELVEGWSKKQEPNWIFTETQRNMKNPASQNYPAAYHDENWADSNDLEDDNGGVHTNNTVISHAAYLMWNGINENAEKKISTEQLAKLWYRAMLMMPVDCDFSTCRQMVEWAALAVDGITDEQRACIAEAFDMVGIEDVTLSPEILVDCDRNVRPNSVLNVYNVEGELHPRYTLNITGTVAERELAYASNILSDIGYRYETTDEITKAKSYHLDLPDGYYTFNITDSNNPKYSYTFTISVSEQGTDNIIELHTDFEDKLVVKVTDPPKSNAYEAYIYAVNKTIASGSWSEHLVMTANMAITDGSAKTKTKVTLTSDADVSNYSESDPSQIRMSGSAEMTVMGQTYAWDMDYENGTAHYRYTKPNQNTADMKIDPSFFNFGTMTSDMMTNAKLSGNKITFTVPDDKIAEVGIAAVNQMSGVDNLEYGDVDVTVTISNDGKIDNIVMAFHASLEYQGYDADVDYTIDYRFSDNANISSKPVSSSLPIVPGIYAQDGSEYNTLTVHETDGQSLEFTAFWYRIADIYHAIAEVNGNKGASFEYIGPDVNWQAAGTLQSPSENEIVLTILDSSHEYINTGEYRYSLIGKIFSDAELKAFSAALNVPADLDTEITQGEPGYWEGGGIYRTPIEIYYNGELIAGASVNSLTGELAGNIYVYSAPSTSGDSADLASTFGFNKSWDIHDRSGTEHFVTSLAFSDDGTFCCAVGWYLSEWYVAFTGTYQVEGNEITLNYTLDGDEKMSSYQVNWENQTLRQTSEENIVIAHQIGSEYPFEENPWYTAEQLKDQVSTFMRYNG